MIFDYARYEQEKQAIQAMNLSPKEYEQAIRNLEKLCMGKNKRLA